MKREDAMHRIDQLAIALAAGSTRREAVRRAGRTLLGTLLASGVVSAAATGAAAARGNNRNTGNKGPKGPSGPSGPHGPSGPNGPHGNTGNQNNNLGGSPTCLPEGSPCDCRRDTCCNSVCCETDERGAICQQLRHACDTCF